MHQTDHSSYAAAVPLPSEQILSDAMGKTYDAEKTLNVVKMFAGAGDLFPAVDGRH